MTSTPEPLHTPFAILLAAPSPAEGIERVFDAFPDMTIEEIEHVAKRARAVRLVQLRDAN